MSESNAMGGGRHIRYLRVSFRVGAVLDALMIIPMLVPGAGGVMFGIAGFDPGNDYGYAMKLAASLMAGWVGLLLWADRKPMERKGVLLLTVVPVIAGLALSGVHAVTTGFVEMEKMIPVWIVQGLLVLLFTGSYIGARREEAG